MVDVEENTSRVGKIMTEEIRKKTRDCLQVRKGAVERKCERRERSLYSRHMVSIDQWAMWPSPGCVVVLCKPLSASECSRLSAWVSSYRLRVVIPSACLGVLSIWGLELASVSALGLHCVYFSRQTSEDVIKRQWARSKRPRGTSSRVHEFTR